MYFVNKEEVYMLTWHDVIGAEKQKEYFQRVMAQVKAERAQGMPIYPPERAVFNALAYTKLADIKAVIIGQDPYHGYGQAHGLCFSVLPGVKIPPSLRNIYEELHREYGNEFVIPEHGCLVSWAKQGVLLLNNTLTVREGQPQSHANLGWEEFTDKVIEAVNLYTEHTVFMLWGTPAQKKGRVVDMAKHLVLKTTHPSPLSAYRGFLGCGHFIACNKYLVECGKKPIDWRLPISAEEAQKDL